jgi:hypothetical protein
MRPLETAFGRAEPRSGALAYHPREAFRERLGKKGGSG